MNRRTLTAATACLAIGLVGVGAASPAVAADDDIWTPTMRWIYVDDTYPALNDVQSGYVDLLGSGVSLPFGWTADAFDQIVRDTAIDGFPIVWAAAPGGAGWVDNGLSSFSYTGVAAGFDASFVMSATMEIEGSYARWTFEQVGGPVGTLTFQANLGSDYSQTATVVTPNSAAVSSDDYDADPVIGYWFDGASGTMFVPTNTDSSDFVQWSAETSAVATVVVAVQDYAPCAAGTARSEMIARVATLDATFGQAVEGALECATVTPASAMQAGAPTSQALAVTLDPAVNTWMASPYQLASRPAYLSDPSVVGNAFAGLPAGVTGSFDAATGQAILSGAPTSAGTYSVALVLYLTDVQEYRFGGVGNGYPVVARFSLEVTAAELAATGVDDVTPALAGAALLMILAGAAATGARRKLARR